MIESAPYITPADPLPVASTITQSNVLPQVPLVQSTQILTQPTPVIASQAMRAASVVTSVTPTVTAPAPQFQYVPVASVMHQPRGQITSGVKVVPIYDDF